MATEGGSPSSAMMLDRETVGTQPPSPKTVTPFPLAENLLLIAKNSEPEQAFSAYISDIVPDVTNKKLDTQTPFAPFVVNEKEAGATEALSNQEELEAAVEALNVKDEGLDVIVENGGEGVLEDSVILEEAQESTIENGESSIVESLSFEETLLNVPDVNDEVISENGTALTVEEALTEGGKALERTETDIDLLNNTSEFETLIELVGRETLATQDINGAGEEMSGQSTSSENGSKFTPTKQPEMRNVDGNVSAQKSPATSVSGQKTPEASTHRRSSTTSTTAHQQSPSGTSIVGDILYSIATGDEEGRNRQRILAFAAKRYANNVERNPQDHDALYNWALVLQESADNAGPEVGSPGKDALLEEACKKYDAATRICPFLHEAFYNWAIAISDRAKIRGRTKEAEDLWKQACDRYDQSVQLNWNSPQALNNWGLALQELGAIVPAKEKRMIVKKAIRKFRAAIQLRFDFHRAVYNLGTVLYGLAEDTLRSGRKLSLKEAKPAELYSQSAIYIATAHALKPDYPVYRSALRLVRSMLPLPYLKAGWIIIPPDGNSLAPHSTWERLWFVLDHEALYEIKKIDRKALAQSYSRRAHNLAESHTPSTAPRPSVLRLEMEDVVFMAPCSDLSLPPGGGFRIDTISGPKYLIADTWESMEAWVDAIRLVYTIYAQGKRDALAGLLAG